MVIAVMEMRWMMLKCYSELLRLTTFKERYEYLRLDGVVGEETFGFDRYVPWRLLEYRRSYLAYR